MVEWYCCVGIKRNEKQLREMRELAAKGKRQASAWRIEGSKR